MIVLSYLSTIQLIFRNEGGFDLEGALESLVDKYGKEEESTASPKKSTKKRKKDTEADDENEEEEEGDSKQKKKAPKKTEIVAEERNRPIAEAIKEMADIYFKNKDARKGGVFSKAAKAIRECESVITTKKEAKALKGVGDGIAGYIEELLQTGSIKKLEELRAGYA
jgi:hypothetical protein